MSAAKHTPGPWSLETVPTSIGTCHKIGPFPCNSGIRETTYACVYADNIREHDYGHSKTGDELLANARLIAASPDLLAEAESNSAILQALLFHLAPLVSPKVAGDIRARVHATSAAIAKAKGRA